jgi:hypothetical protein
MNRLLADGFLEHVGEGGLLFGCEAVAPTQLGGSVVDVLVTSFALADLSNREGVGDVCIVLYKRQRFRGQS